jgi:AcrR family transcriptional regulator
LFREAIALYEAAEGGFADRALSEPTARAAIERMLRDVVDAYTSPGRPLGCMVVSAATNCSSANDAVMSWLADHRRVRTASIIERLKQAVARGELPSKTNVEAFGDCFAALLHGLSVQARDGVPKKRLLALIPPALEAFDHSC